ncbi:hypothetical protein [Nonomuraea sp. LPB2021202275-12-8]
MVIDRIENRIAALPAELDPPHRAEKVPAERLSRNAERAIGNRV